MFSYSDVDGGVLGVFEAHPDMWEIERKFSKKSTRSFTEKKMKY